MFALEVVELVGWGQGSEVGVVGWGQGSDVGVAGSYLADNILLFNSTQLILFRWTNCLFQSNLKFQGVKLLNPMETYTICKFLRGVWSPCLLCPPPSGTLTLVSAAAC